MKKDDKKKKMPRAAQSKSGKPSKQPKPSAKATGKTTGKTFETAEEAANYAVDVLLRTGEAVPVERTDRQVTHTFKPEEQKKKK